MKIKSKVYFILLIASILFLSCGGPVTKNNVENLTAVEIKHVKGKTFRGYVVDNSPQEIKIILEKNHKGYTVSLSDIESLKEIDVIYDDYARPISESEIKAEKTYWRTASFGLLGAIFGGAVGFFASGQANPDDEAEVASAGTFIGSAVGAGAGVYLGLNGDEQKAIDAARDKRKKDPPAELKDEKAREEEKLKKLEEEKKKLQQQLKEKKK